MFLIVADFKVCGNLILNPEKLCFRKNVKKCKKKHFIFYFKFKMNGIAFLNVFNFSDSFEMFFKNILISIT